MRQIGIAVAVTRNRFLPERALFSRAARIGEDHRQGHLALAEIVALVLAHFGRVGIVVDGIVRQLERDAKVAAIRIEREFIRLAALRHHGGDAARGSEQRRRLGVDDGEVAFLARLHLPLRDKLIDFAFRDHGGGVREDLEHLEAAVLDHQLEAAAEQEIAHEHGSGVAIDDVGGLLAAAHARAIDDIVMQQRGGVDELHRRRQLVVPTATITQQRRAREGEHRAHALAAASDEMACQRRDQRDARLHPAEDHFVDTVHAIGHERHKRLQRRLGAAGDLVDGSCHRQFAWPAHCRLARCKLCQGGHRIPVNGAV